MANAQTIAVRREHVISAHAPAADGEPLRPGHTPLGVGIRRQGEAYKQPTPQTVTGRLGPCVAKRFAVVFFQLFDFPATPALALAP